MDIYKTTSTSWDRSVTSVIEICDRRLVSIHEQKLLSDHIWLFVCFRGNRWISMGSSSGQIQSPAV